MLAAGSLRFVFRRGRRSIDEIFATVVAYLLVAVLFAQLYELVLQFNPQSSTSRRSRTARRSSCRATCSTSASSRWPRSGTATCCLSPRPRRSLAVVEAVVGQFYVAVIVSVFIGMYTIRARGLGTLTESLAAVGTA